MSISKRLLESRSFASRRIGSRISNSGPFVLEVRDGASQKYERTHFAIDKMEAFNTQVKSWGDKVIAQLKGSVTSHKIKGRYLKRSIGTRYRYDSGEIYRIGFKFKRQGVFVHKGVGRGYKASGNKVIKVSKTPGFRRHPKPWFNPVIAASLPELEQIIANYAKTAVINTTRILIQ